MFAAELRELQEATSEPVRRGIQGRIRLRARAGAEALPIYLAGLRPDRQQDGATLCALIESLAPEPTEWESLLEQQLERVLALCDSEPPAALLSVLQAFMFLESHSRPQFRELLRVKYIRGLACPAPQVRKACIDLLGGYRVGAHPDLLMALRSLLDDPEWRVRSAAEWLLQDEGMLPDRYRPRIGDRLRRTFLGWQ
jgi:hypothetical protein